MIETNELRPSPQWLTPEQSNVLTKLCQLHEKAPVALRVSPWSLAAFFAICLLTCAGLILFPGRVPPFVSTLLSGFAFGFLASEARRQMAFERVWPLYEWIIDWGRA